VALHLVVLVLERLAHDLHDTRIPEAVWDLLDDVLTRSHPTAVILEYETNALREGAQTLDRGRTIDSILADLERARRAWDHAYGAQSRRTTRCEMT